MNNSQTNEQLIAYYVGLLIQEYSGATSPQIVTFSSVPAAGQFTLTFGTLNIGGNGITGGFEWDVTNFQLASAFENVPFSDQYSISFNGTSQYVATGTSINSVLAYNKPFSISAWVYQTTDAIQGNVYGTGIPGGGAGGAGVTMAILSGVNPLIYISSDSNSHYIQAYAAGYTVPLNTWTHLVWTYDGSNTAGGNAIYANGVSLALTNSGSSTITSFTPVNPFNIGNSASGSSFFPGSVSEVAVYDIQLTAGQVAAIYNNGVVPNLDSLPTENNLSAWWRLNGNLLDPVGGNSGTAVGAPSFTTNVPPQSSGGSIFSPSSDPNNPETYNAQFPYALTITGNALSLVSILFPATPASGTFKLTYGASSTSALAHNASAATIQTALRLLSGLSGAVVSGSIAPGAGGGLLIQTNDLGPGQCLHITSNGLLDSAGNAIFPTTSSSIVFDFGNNTPIVLGSTNVSLTDISALPVSIVTSGDLVKAAMTIQTITKTNVANQLPAIIQDAYNLIPTVQTIQFASVPTTGSFAIQLAVTSTPSISTTSTALIFPTDLNKAIINKVNAILPSGSVSISGSLPQGVITLSFYGVNPTVISVVANTTGVSTTVDTNLAYGAQLDVIAKYAGVSRQGNGPAGAVTLTDSDLYTLIQFGIILNNFGSSLADIDNLLYTFFQNNIHVYDNEEMQLGYVVNGSYFSNALLDCIISQNLLPKPMGVQIASVVILPAGGEFFAFCDAQIPTNRTGYGFNDVNSYTLNTPWLGVNDAI